MGRPPRAGAPRIGLKTAPIRVGWTDLRAVWARAGELDCFDSAWVYDHFYPNDGDGSCLEGTVTLAALAHLVPNARVGHLVLANPYRHPALVAKLAATMDNITGGRFVLGLGAGWHEPETVAYGMPLAPVSQRLAELRAAIAVIRALMSPPASAWPDDGSASAGVGGVTLDAPPYRLDHARNDPPPVQGSGLPIWLGVQGERVGLPLAGAVADGWNFSGTGSVEDFARKREIVLQSAVEAGRSPEDIEISAQVRVSPAEPAEAVRLGNAYVGAGCDHLILYVDPRWGPRGLDTVADLIVRPIRGG